jgi:predicted metal-dependent HD superfamily phosphohydrolase
MAATDATSQPAALGRRWEALGRSLGLPADVGSEWSDEGRRLLRSWNRWPRAYHDQHHLAACLRHFDAVADQLAQPQTVELALWYHDAIYWPWSRHNETRSAEWAGRFLRSLPLPPSLADTVHQHVLDTRHVAPPPPGDAQWLIDIDLAILGQPDAVYRQFERDVRAEYRFIPWRRYALRRQGVLGHFAAREHIYGTPWFRARLEAQARLNLAHAIEALARGELYGPQT